MRYSISNIAWTKENDEEMYSKMSSLNIEGLEIAPTRIFPENPYDHKREAKEWAVSMKESYGFCIPSMQSIWYGKSENIWNSENERNELFEYTKKAIEFANAIDCKNLVFGCPRNRNMMQDVSDEVVCDFFYRLGEYACSCGTTIGMEANPVMYNTNFINTTTQAIELINKVQSKGFKLNLDFGTMIFNKEREDCLLGNEDLINHVHISEPGLVNISVSDLHHGVFDLLRKSEYKGFVSIEMSNQYYSDINQAIDNMLKL